MTFTAKLDWKNDPTAPAALPGETPVTAEELIRIETGVKDAHDAIEELPAPFSGAYGDLTGKPTIPTLPSLATAAELQAGTVTTARLVSPKLIHDEIARQIAAIPPAG
ncbi:hypothetical protein XU06_22950 [Rhodococcus erythropolis]|uniref:hypothetical protein n=1 Tax=Rhodococcus erythropolis TaxID=1833 RepID=UPI00061B6581|nr:hypothetical protein [Rhodococcus erythropolis]AKD99212.1 hypothetical protein XU06_22950 [Rhodococcus erythropolis]